MCCMWTCAFSDWQLVVSSGRTRLSTPASQRQQGLAEAVAVKVAATLDAHADGQQSTCKTRLLRD